MKNKILFIIFSLIFLAVSCNRQEAYQGPIANVGGSVLNIEIADTIPSQLQGLSGRQSLPQDNGMLFVFTESHRYTFWMKDMKFPIDFIWIMNNKVFEINADAQPEPGVKDSNLKIYTPSEKVNKVLEVNAGWARRKGIKPGDVVDVNR